MKYLKLFEDTFNDIYKKKNKWVELIDRNKIDELKSNLFILVNNAYGKIGGNNIIKYPEDIFKRSYWEAIDIDKDPDADSLLFGRRTKYGIKITGIGHDGNRKSKKVLINKLHNQLKRKGYYMEASGKLEQKLHDINTKYIEDYDIIKTVLNTEIQELENGYYKKYLKDKKIYTSDENRLYGTPDLVKSESIRDKYQKYGVNNFYKKYGNTYYNPHENQINKSIKWVDGNWDIDFSNVLDLAAGSGEVTISLMGCGYKNIDAVDPFTSELYIERTGNYCKPISFDDITFDGGIKRYYSTIICSFAMHLYEPSKIPLLVWELSQKCDNLLILSPHKKPLIKSEWGLKLFKSNKIDDVLIRWFKK